VSQADEVAPLSEAEEAAILLALEAALRPAELDPALNERLIAQALEDPLAPPTEEELAESARLRDALEGQSPAHEDAATLAALRVAYQAGTPREPDLERVLERALTTRPRRPNVIYAVFGAGSAVLAAAAALVLVMGGSRSEAPVAASVSAESASNAGFAKPRSTAPLFGQSEAFRTADTTARMDLIAGARARDLRDNRYAAWGVR
jgi:hypothetical protein